MLQHVYQQPASVITTTTDKFGDQIASDETEILCRFRYITELDRNADREGLEAFDAIFWFAPDTDVEEGSILAIEGKNWRIYRLVRARRLKGSTVEFLKAFVKKHEL
jgi:hypothetical protein